MVGKKDVETLLVFSGCNNKNTVDWGCFKSRHLIPTVLEAGKAKIKAQSGLGSGDDLLPCS